MVSLSTMFSRTIVSNTTMLGIKTLEEVKRERNYLIYDLIDIYKRFEYARYIAFNSNFILSNILIIVFIMLRRAVVLYRISNIGYLNRGY